MYKVIYKLLFVLLLISYCQAKTNSKPGVDNASSLPYLFELSQELTKIEQINKTPLIAFQVKNHKKAIDSLSRGICFPIITGKKLIKPGDTHNSVPFISYMLKAMGYKVSDVDTKKYTKELAKAVSEFQKHNHIKQDASIGTKTREKLMLCFHQRVEILKGNLAKLENMKGELTGHRIVVNLPTFSLYALKNGKVQLVSRVITGKKSQVTPDMVSNVQAVISNPSWGVPPGIMRRSTIPKIRKNPNYLRKMGFSLTDASGRRVDVSTINWHDSSSYGGVKIRQKPGARNALGLIKIKLDNKKMIYLHDTPSRSLFDKQRRDLSSGCVRVQKIEQLARWVLNVQNSDLVKEFNRNYRTGKNKWHKINKKIPVHMVYFTTWADKKGNILWNDPYQRNNHKKKTP